MDPPGYQRSISQWSKWRSLEYFKKTGARA